MVKGNNEKAAPSEGNTEDVIEDVVDASQFNSNGQASEAINHDNDNNLDPLVLAQRDAKENHERYLRALADFDNYKKRAMKDRSELLKYQGESVIVDLLEVADNLERAVSNEERDLNKLKEGLLMIEKQFIEVLSKAGVRGKSAIGQDFNPEMHQALSQVPSNDHKPGTIISELKKAYYYKDKLIRVGQVVVAGENGENATNSPESKS